MCMYMCVYELKFLVRVESVRMQHTDSLESRLALGMFKFYSTTL